jgi:hypothetical protein
MFWFLKNERQTCLIVCGAKEKKKMRVSGTNGWGRVRDKTKKFSLLSIGYGYKLEWASAARP